MEKSSQVRTVSSSNLFFKGSRFRYRYRTWVVSGAPDREGGGGEREREREKQRFSQRTCRSHLLSWNICPRPPWGRSSHVIRQRTQWRGRSSVLPYRHKKKQQHWTKITALWANQVTKPISLYLKLISATPRWSTEVLQDGLNNISFQHLLFFNYYFVENKNENIWTYMNVLALGAIHSFIQIYSSTSIQPTNSLGKEIQ